jgi:hypothetical protein
VTKPLSDADRAPHGFEDDGVTPKAPFGFNVNGTPRKGLRGAQKGSRGGSIPRASSSAPKVTTNSKTDARRRDTLLSLIDMCLVTPLAAASQAPLVKSRVGPKHSQALAGDAVIVAHYSAPTADALIVLSQTKPGVLAWMDKVEDSAPYLMLAQIGAQMAKAVIDNHMRPNPELNKAGLNMARIRAVQMAEEINRQAEAMGVSVEFEAPAEPVFVPEEQPVSEGWEQVA